MNPHQLTRFWLTFNVTVRDPHPPGVLLGCGVTPFDKEDAVRILKDKVFASHALPEIEAIVANIEIATQ